MMKVYIALSMLLASHGALAAASLNKCVGPTGAVVYQDKPCDLGSKQKTITVDQPTSSTLSQAANFPDLIYSLMLDSCVRRVGSEDRALKELVKRHGESARESLGNQSRKDCNNEFSHFVRAFGRLDAASSRRVSCDILQILEEEIIKAKHTYEKAAYELERIQYKRRCNGERISTITRPLPR